MIDVNIKTIPHQDQRYDTAGDYIIGAISGDGHTRAIELIYVSEIGNHDYEFLVAVHELIEWYLTERRGIKETDIMAFDVDHPDLDDPGNDPAAPYHREHMFATEIEKMLCAEMGLDWNVYYKAFDGLEYK
ncbi:MAG TPA: hypothetical protein DCO75_07525 [Fibrobacteres bacterium]|jgi:hypothetical protein|nr:hypothetical protein [Fibrobacterota bacterium]